jgi:hypothetical protein
MVPNTQSVSENMGMFVPGSVFSSVLETIPLNWAYLDPGTGSMVLQILLAGALSGAFFLKSWVRQIRDGLRFKNSSA